MKNLRCLKLKCLVFVFTGIFLCGLVSGMAGVTPAVYELDFKPGLNERFDFTFIFDEGTEAEIYFSGDLAEHVSTNTKKISGRESISVLLRLPKEIDKPGLHEIRVGARQIPDVSGGISLTADIGGLIRVKVPYPGKYADVELRASNANAGEPVDTELRIFSKGVEDIYAAVFLVVSNENGEVEGLSLGSHFIASAKNIKLEKAIDTSGYLAGDYNLTAIVEYGGEKPTEAKAFFRLGRLYVGISNYTKIFEREKIARMEIEVESFWNDRIDNVHANVSIPESGLSFLTPSMSVEPWKKRVLTGFFDTSKIEESKFEANITLYYEDQLTSEIVDLKMKEKIDPIVLIIGGLILAIVILLVIIFFVLIKYKGLKLSRGKK